MKLASASRISVSSSSSVLVSTQVSVSSTWRFAQTAKAARKPISEATTISVITSFRCVAAIRGKPTTEPSRRTRRSANEGLAPLARNTPLMADQGLTGPAGRWLRRWVEQRGLRPRTAIYLVLGFWSIAVIVFGVAIRAADPGSFGTIWDGMWWAVQTVTTVGYGDIVPD